MRSNRRAASASRAPHAKRWFVVGAVVAAVGAIAAAQLSAVAYASSKHSGYPVGHVDRIRQDAAGLYLRGWAYDRGAHGHARIRVNVDGKRVALTYTTLARSDVARNHPSYGSHTGFHYKAAVPQGRHTVCVYAVDMPSYHRVLLRCKRINFQFNPFGTITSLTQTPGHLTAKGWAIDPNDEKSARRATVRVDGTIVGRATANRPVTGLSTPYPKAGANHGYTVTFPVAEGTHQICVAASNIGLGRSATIRCVTKSVNFSPTGAITRIEQLPGGFGVHGDAVDPDTSAATTVTITADGKPLATIPANRRSGKVPGHHFVASLKLPGTNLAAGNRTICAVAKNLMYGKDRAVQCVSYYFNWNPSAWVSTLVQHSPGATITGWATDPDTSAPVTVNISADGKYVTHVLANGAGGSHSGHMYTANVKLPDGMHTVCARAVNLSYGSGYSKLACSTVKLAFEPFGALESLGRDATNHSTNIVATGWTIDPDTTGSVPVQVTVTGGAAAKGTANVLRSDIAKKYPGTGTSHGYRIVVPSDDKEHTVCVTAVNLLGGSGTTKLGCRIINAVHPVKPSAPGKVSADAGYGGATVTWTAPTSDGGAPWSGYTVKASGSTVSATVGPTATSATLLGLKPSTKYSFSVVANNVAGQSSPGTSPAVTTEKEPPAQTTPAPVSTSRYIRNIGGASSSDLKTMYNEGKADAAANPSGHGYLVLLDIGGQSGRGVVLSATIRYVSDVDLVADLKSYVDGYASQLKPSAPATIAIGTNNDVDVSAASGAAWADSVVDPVASYAGRYPGITIAGANDVEPGFRASYSQTRSWLSGYLGATHAPFIFNGSADGCSWTAPARGCNNGWTMSGLFTLAGGASPIRILNLPQIYNSTMAQQWRYISLTGVRAGSPRINFGGALTEYTACRQAHSCGSLTGTTAWKYMWSQLNAEPQLRPRSLPYATDLRIDS